MADRDHLGKKGCKHKWGWQRIKRRYSCLKCSMRRQEGDRPKGNIQDDHFRLEYMSPKLEREGRKPL